ncbi:MAG: cytochrome P450 [Deinococcus sp.]|uniref:cytochrome P450 n=1 Tax=Deinococcus sp. TaxID=47478 RepID=UPI0026DA9E7F|nr:cytochrome P450 [Deinococcus sp.]MDO4245320.1 cytochrome P450 [Deinococcus sp.]
MTQPNESAPRCPFSGQTESLTRRHDRLGADNPEPAHLEQLQHFDAVRQILKDDEADQMGFLAKFASDPRLGRAPVLYMKGDEHTEMRRATARYFTPTAVNSYGPMIAALCDEMLAELLHKGEMNLDDLSLRLAVQVAASVVGLTDSRLPGMEKRIEAFVSSKMDGAPGAVTKSSPVRDASMAGATGLFFMLDVKPAIEARRKAPKDDLISYLLERDYTDQEILTECITYATAGMITTREFITLAAYQMLQKPELRSDYVHGTEKERHAILHELLRLDPVVTMLYRKTERDLEIGGQHYPAGTTFGLNIQTANVDPAIMGENAEELCPHRKLPRGVQAQGLAFGDGAHRCPGAFLAIKESDMFLRRLLMWQDLEIVKHPHIGSNEIVKGYELRGLRVRLGDRHRGTNA